LVEISNRALIILLAIVSDAAVVESVGMFFRHAIALGAVSRSQPDRHAEVGNGTVKFLLVSIGEAAIVKCPYFVRSEPDGLIVIANGMLVIALIVVSNATAAERVRILRIEPDDVGIVGNGVLVILVGGISEGTVVEGRRVCRIDFKDLAICSNGMLVILFPIILIAAHSLQRKPGGAGETNADQRQCRGKSAEPQQPLSPSAPNSSGPRAHDVPFRDMCHLLRSRLRGRNFAGSAAPGASSPLSAPPPRKGIWA